MSLADALERAAQADLERASAIRPANGNPERLLEHLDAEGAARVLEWLLANEPAAGEELAAAWTECDGGAPALGAVREARLPKAGRKTLRRVRHRARSRGIALPEAPPPRKVARLAPVEDEVTTALVSPIDPAGARLITLIEANPAGGVRLFQVAIDAARGVLDCNASTATRAQARRLVGELRGRKGFASVPVPADAARALVARAAAAQPADRSFPRAFVEWRSHLAGVPTDAPTPGELAREALGAGGDSGRLARAIELVRRREIGPWISEPEALMPTVEKLQGVATGRIIVSGLQKREQIDALLHGAVAEVFDGEEARRAEDRFAETAYWLWKCEREEDARACLAAAAEIGGRESAQSAVLRALLETALAPVLEKLGESEREREESSLLVKP